MTTPDVELEFVDRVLMDRIRTVDVSLGLVHKFISRQVDDDNGMLSVEQLRLVGDVFDELVGVLPELAADMLRRADVLDPAGAAAS